MFVPLVSALGAPLLKLLAATWRWRYSGDDVFRRHVGEGGVILPFWHNRILGACTAPIFRRHDTVVVVSRHKDGEIITRIQARFGHRAVRGSSGKGGGEALAAMEVEIRAGSVVGITPDGPRGPRYRVQPGAAILAERTGRPVIPFLPVARRRKKFASWDRFELPRPFTEITVLFGEAIFPLGEVEATRSRIEDSMRHMVEEGERLYGRGATDL
jgi:hypothetical protein